MRKPQTTAVLGGTGLRLRLPQFWVPKVSHRGEGRSGCVDDWNSIWATERGGLRVCRLSHLCCSGKPRASPGFSRVREL